MRVFVSWSGSASKELARSLADWLPTVVQAVVPFMSDDDIAKGIRWSDRLTKELAETQFGVICLTPDNKDAPWIHFEAGALSKVFSEARVVPLLFDITPTDIRGPLAAFQSVGFSKDEILNLLRSINQVSGKPAIEDDRLTRIFDALWPSLSESIEKVLSTHRKQWGSGSAAQRKPDLGRVEQAVEEILAIVREGRQSGRSEGQPASNRRPLRSILRDLGQVRVDSGEVVTQTKALRSMFLDLVQSHSIEQEARSAGQALRDLHSLSARVNRGIIAARFALRELVYPSDEADSSTIKAIEAVIREIDGDNSATGENATSDDGSQPSR